MPELQINRWEEQRAEARLRQVMFHVAYKSYENVQDLTLRFGYAIAHSSLPIKDRALFREWWAFTRGASLQAVLKDGRTPPARIHKLVEAWKRAQAERDAFEKSGSVVLCE